MRDWFKRLVTPVKRDWLCYICWTIVPVPYRDEHLAWHEELKEMAKPEPVQMQKVVTLMRSINGRDAFPIGWTEKDTQVAAGLYPEHIYFFSETPEDDDG